MPSPFKPLATLGLAASGLAAIATYGALAAQSQLFGPTLIAPPRPDEIALTFDDGPNPTATPYLLDILARHGVHATFFLIGRFALSEPALTRRIAAEGHSVGNHTMTHPWLPRHSDARIREEIHGCNRALEDTLGQPVTLFRPPHGARRPAVLRIARELGLATVQWNVIVGDWKPVSAEVIRRRLEARVERNQQRGQGSNVVLHDGGQGRLGEPRIKTVEAVNDFLSRSRSQTFVRLADWV